MSVPPSQTNRKRLKNGAETVFLFLSFKKRRLCKALLGEEGKRIASSASGNSPENGGEWGRNQNSTHVASLRGGKQQLPFAVEQHNGVGRPQQSHCHSRGSPRGSCCPGLCGLGLTGPGTQGLALHSRQTGSRESCRQDHSESKTRILRCPLPAMRGPSLSHPQG
jgi:hypothetical protein